MRSRESKLAALAAIVAGGFSLCACAPSRTTASPPNVPTSSASLPVQSISDSDRRCLAIAAFTEARSEGADGMGAVMRVITNRIHDSRYPDSICGVTHQPGQFQAVRAWGDRQPMQTEQAQWKLAFDLAGATLSGEHTYPETCADALSFNQATRSRQLRVVCVIGVHTFYADAANTGTPR
jgi:N-acetylmuramoyl-L-alanine amidase